MNSIIASLQNGLEFLFEHEVLNNKIYLKADRFVHLVGFFRALIAMWIYSVGFTFVDLMRAWNWFFYRFNYEFLKESKREFIFDVITWNCGHIILRSEKLTVERDSEKEMRWVGKPGPFNRTISSVKVSIYTESSGVYF